MSEVIMTEFNFYLTSKQCKQQAKEALHGNWGQAVGITALYALVVLLIAGVLFVPTIFVWWASIPASVVLLIFVSLFNYGYTNYFLKLAKGDETSTKLLFSGFGKKSGAILKNEIKRFFLSIFWLILLIVPCLVKNIGYSMSTLVIADTQNTKGLNALKKSKHLMNKNYGRYFKFVLSFLLWFLLTLVTGGIAGLWAMPLFMASNSAFYENLKTEF